MKVIIYKNNKLLIYYLQNLISIPNPDSVVLLFLYSEV